VARRGRCSARFYFHEKFQSRWIKLVSRACGCGWRWRFGAGAQEDFLGGAAFGLYCVDGPTEHYMYPKSLTSTLNMNANVCKLYCNLTARVVAWLVTAAELESMTGHQLIQIRQNTGWNHVSWQCACPMSFCARVVWAFCSPEYCETQRSQGCCILESTLKAKIFKLNLL
jgi:hypothetical protein